MQSQPSRLGLNGLNFFIAAVQTGFGPFVSVWLIKQGWSQTDVGLALSIGTFVALLGQVPAGGLVDAVHWKRPVITAAMVAIGLSAMMLAWLPTRGPVWIAEALHAFASCVITPAIAAITLRLCGHAAYSERLGMNGRYAALGSAVAAGLLGLCAWFLSEQAVFIATALLVVPALVALYAIRRDDAAEAEDHGAVLHPRERRRQRASRPWHIFSDLKLHVFAVCAALFNLSNAAMLPLALNALAQRISDTGLIVSTAILLPQLVAAAIAPRAGALAQRLGRRPVLLVGFAAVPLRGVLFSMLFILGPSAVPVLVVPLLLVQLLDGVSAAVFGLMVPLVAADLTRHSGYLNLAIGSLGLAAGLGATISTTLAGWMADSAGLSVALLGLSAAGGLALLILWLAMPETNPVRSPRTKSHALTA